MKRLCFILFVLLYSLCAPAQEFGIALRCGGQCDFVSEAPCGGTGSITALGVLHVGRLDLSLGIGYSYKSCTERISVTTDIKPLSHVTYQRIHQMHFLNVPFIIEVRCWEHDRFVLKVFSEAEANRLCEHREYDKSPSPTTITEKWKEIPRSAWGGLTFRVGMTASFSLSEHCILNVTPFLGVKAVLNQHESWPVHFYQDEIECVPDHRCSSGIILGVEYRF